MKYIFLFFKISSLLSVSICANSCSTNVNKKDSNSQPEQVQVSVKPNKLVSKGTETFEQKVKRVNDECEINAETEWECKEAFMPDESKLTQDQKDIIKHTFNYSNRLAWAFPERAKTKAEFRKVAEYKAQKARQETLEGKAEIEQIMEGHAAAGEKASPEQMQSDRENACNAQLNTMGINTVVCAETAKVLTSDLEMSDWMSSIKITYPLRFDKNGVRLPEDDAYSERVKAFYKAHGQDINNEETYHPSKIVASPIAHVGAKPSQQIPENCDVWCKSTFAVKVNDIQDVRRFIIDWESRTKGESQAESDVGKRSDESIYGQFRAIRHRYDKSF